MNLAAFLPPLEVTRDIGLSLAHFLWQGAAIALALRLVLVFCKNPVARHNWSLAAVAALGLAPIATFLVLRGPAPQAVSMVGDLQATFPPPYAPQAWWNAVVAVWLAGILVLAVRAAGGWWLSQTLRDRDTAPLTAAMEARCQALRRQLAGAWPVRFLQSTLVAAPVVIGWLKPLILIPAGAIARLSPDQLDALILHELAHVRRLDAASNLLLMLVETVLFYHPAVWWTARQVRIEREHCCDDIAVAANKDPAAYVEALTTLEAMKPSPFVLAANGGELRDRAARLLGAPKLRRRFSLWMVLGIAILGLVAAPLVLTRGSTSASAAPAITFALRLVDETAGPEGAPDEDRVGDLWLKRENTITGDMLDSVDSQRDALGKPAIGFSLTPEGRARMSAMTKDSIGSRIAIVIDGKIVSSPVVRSHIEGPGGIVAGDFDEAEVERLVAGLRAGRASKP